MQNLGHLFDDIDNRGSEMSECPETPLHMFPNTPTSELLLQQGHFNHFFPEAQTPPQVYFHEAHFLTPFSGRCVYLLNRNLRTILPKPSASCKMRV